MDKMNKHEIEKECNRLVDLGVLRKNKVKGKYYYQDSKLSNKIDKSTQREAFMLGVKKGQEQTQKDLDELEKAYDIAMQEIARLRKELYPDTELMKSNRISKTKVYSWDEVKSMLEQTQNKIIEIIDKDIQWYEEWGEDEIEPDKEIKSQANAILRYCKELKSKIKEAEK